MKANEWMIDDYALVHPSMMPIKIAAIHKKKVAYHSTPDKLTWVRMDLLRPIPLAKETLEKNGFVANNHVYPYPYYEYIDKEHKLKIDFAFPQGNRTSYKDPWVYIDTENAFIEHLPCIYVHQLQKAMRLCGINHEIII